ncbi:MAG: CoA-disulfide reductase [Xanthomonadaceae bacterium]|nr:CoA-disulfide reductase [Xanthomonadaceae bacterium]
MNIIIIGGIAAGMSVAAKAKREAPEATVTVIEAEDYISFGACGLPYYLAGHFDDPNTMFARTPEQMEAQGITILTRHLATGIHFDQKAVSVRNLATEDEMMMHYDRLMIATGATPVKPPIAGIDADNVYTLTKLNDTQKLKDSLDQYETIGVIGGGFIGIEVAEQLALMGKKVKLIQASGALINRPFDPEFSAKILTALEETGVKVALNTLIESFTLNEQKNVTQMVSKESVYHVDAVVVAIGFRPNTAFITDPRLKKLDNGAIVINAYGETSIPDVFSAGDCATIPHKFHGNVYLPLATGANKMGRVIGTNIVSENKHREQYVGSLGSSAIKVGHYEAGSTGLTERDAKALNIPYKTTTITTQSHTAYYPGATPIDIKLVYNAESKILLGAQLFGKKDAVLRMTGLSTAIYANLKTDEIGLLDYAYAPPFSLTWEALNIAANTAK